MVEIDGSLGEGGGQIVRTALSLSCLTDQAMRIRNIRQGREKPGLMAQHLACVRAAAEISKADVSGAVRGSTELLFKPRKIRSGRYSFDIGTAGSTSLVFQTLLPPLLFGDNSSRITIRGGTHVPWSPSYHYIAEVFIPVLRNLRIEVSASIGDYGFYPRGGGEINFTVSPAAGIRGLNAEARGPLKNISGHSGVARLAVSIAERQRTSVVSGLSPLSADLDILDVPSPGPGTFVFLRALYGDIPAGFSAIGKRGKPAEDVGREAAESFHEHHESLQCLDRHLADQIVIYLCLAGGRSSFSTSAVTPHLMTNLHIIKEFLAVDYHIRGEPDCAGRVEIIPRR